MSDTPDTLLEAPDEPSRPKKVRKYEIVPLMTGMAMAVLVIYMVVVQIQQFREGAHRSHCKNNLEAIGRALHMYHEAFKVLPPAYTVDANGEPLHSWRTLILPYLDELALYQTIDLSKPWNDPANANAYATPVRAYACSSHGPYTNTNYSAIVNPGTCIRVGVSRTLSQITDGRRNTILVMEVPDNHAVHWMSPLDAGESVVLKFGQDAHLPHSGGVHALLADGKVRFISSKIAPDTLRYLISAAGGDVLCDDF